VAKKEKVSDKWSAVGAAGLGLWIGLIATGPIGVAGILSGLAFWSKEAKKQESKKQRKYIKGMEKRAKKFIKRKKKKGKVSMDDVREIFYDPDEE
jgi:hypothetical protein